MDCPNGHGPMLRGQKSWLCEECGQRFPLAPAGPRPELIDLPSLLAIPLQEYATETQPVLRLHRLCDAVEVVTRFCAVVALAEVRVVLGDEPLPRDLLRILQPHIERPTFGQWRDMLQVLLGSLRRETPLVVPQLPDFVSGHLLPWLRGGDLHAEESLLALRNQLAHGGGTTRAAAGSLLHVWEPRLESLSSQLAFLARAQVCHFSGGVTRLLVGPRHLSGEEVPLSADLGKALRDHGLAGHVVLLREGRWLDLWPLCSYGRAVSHSPGGARRATEDCPLIYVRAQRARLLYAALGVEWPQGEQSDADTLRLFRHLFQLDTRLPILAEQLADFEAEIRADAAALVGRKEEVEQVKRLLREAERGVFWVSGPGGIGKSFLLAKVAQDLGNAKDVCRIAWRFQAGAGARCSREAFFRHAVEKLGRWLGMADVTPAADPNELHRQLAGLLDEAARRSPVKEESRPPRVLFVLDGLDEIERLDPTFVEVPLQGQRANVLWLCAGRPVGRLPQLFTTERCTHVFPGGLSGMSASDIRGMLLDGTGKLKYQLLPLDREETVGGEGGERRTVVVNEAVEAVVRRAAGLPLYVRFAVEDILAGHFRFNALEGQLPLGLDAYYDDLLRRLLTIGELPALLTPLVVTLTWALAPLDEETLHLVMVRRSVATAGEEGRALVRRGLEAVQALIRAVPLEGGVGIGYEPYHPSFREHVRQDAGGVIGQQNPASRDALCSLVRDWAEVPREHPGRRYVLRHGPGHLIEENDLRGLVALVRGDFLQSVSRELGTVEALLVARDIARGLGRDGDAHWKELLRCAYAYCALAERLRAAPRAWEGMIHDGAIDQIIAILQADPDEFRRGVCQLSVAPFLAKANFGERAEELQRSGDALVRTRLTSGAPSIAGYSAQTWLLLRALLDRGSHFEGSSEQRPPAGQPAVVPAATDPARRTPFPGYYLVLAYLISRRLTDSLAAPLVLYFWLLVLFANVFLQDGLAILREPLRQVMASPWGLLIAGGFVFLVVGLLALGMLNVLTQKWLRSECARIMADHAGIALSSSAAEQREALLRALRFQALLGRPPEESTWSANLAVVLGRAVSLLGNEAGAATRLILDVISLGDTANDALIDALCRLSPMQLGRIHEELERHWSEVGDSRQMVRVLLATSDRLADASILIDFLETAEPTWSEQVRTEVLAVLQGTSSSCLGRAVLASMDRNRQTLLGRLRARWRSALLGFDVGLPRAGTPPRFHRLLPLLWPMYLCLGLLLLGGIALVGIPWLVLNVLLMLTARAYDPYLLARVDRHGGSRPWRRRLAQALERLHLRGAEVRRAAERSGGRPRKELPGVTRLELAGEDCLVTDFSPGRALVLALPFAARARTLLRVEEMVLAQEVLRDEWAGRTGAPARSVRRVMTSLLRARLVDRRSEFVLWAMGDRDLLDAVAALKPPRGQAKPLRVIDESGDAEGLRAVLPLPSRGRSFQLVSGLSCLAALSWWAAASWFAGPAVRPWLPLWGLACLALCLYLAVMQHSDGLLHPRRRSPSFLCRTPFLPPIANAGLFVGFCSVVLFAWLLVGVMALASPSSTGRASLSAGAAVGFLVPLVSLVITNFLVPELIARWRGAGLFYPSTARLWWQRLTWVLLLAGSCVLGAWLVA
jgi:hypothetical protein